MTDTTTWIALGINQEILPTVKDPHITLAFLGELTGEYVESDISMTQEILFRIQHYFPKKFEVIPEYPELWANGNLLVSPVMVPEQVREMRRLLTAQLFDWKIWFSTQYAWRPHITLGEKGSAHTVPEIIQVENVFLQTPSGRTVFQFQ